MYGLPKAIQEAHSLPPLYTIELICDNLRNAPCSEIAKVMVHELLHIPQTFSGGLRPHGPLVNNRRARSLARRIPESVAESLCDSVEKCCGSL